MKNTALKLGSAGIAALMITLCACVSSERNQAMAATLPGPAVDSLEIVPVMSAALADVRAEYAFGRVLFDRVVADTTKRLLPPLLTGREHRAPEDWAKPNFVETVQTEGTGVICQSGNIDCQLPDAVSGVVAFSDPEIQGNTARVIARWSKNGGGAVGRVTTTVEALTLEKVDGGWKVTDRKVRAKT